MGALVVIIAIVGTILGGTALGADEVTRTTTDYSYVTDISGLFEYSDQRLYVDYEPSSNLTGFHKYGLDYTSGITYDAASSLSNYPIKQQQTPSSGTLTLSASSTSRFILQCKLYPDQGDGTAAFYYTVNQPYVQSMTDALSGVIGSAYNLDRIEITAKSYTDLGPVVVRASDILQSPNNPSWTYCKWYPTLENVTSYVFEDSTQIFKAISSDGTVSWQANIDDVRVIWGGTVNNATISPSSSTLSDSLSYKLYEKVTPIYLDPTKGVGLDGNVAIWQNGYTNQKVSLMFIFSDDTSVISFNASRDGSTDGYNFWEYDLMYTTSGVHLQIYKAKYYVNGSIQSSVSVTSKDFDGFSAIRADIDVTTNSVNFIPIGPAQGQSTVTFTSYVEYPSLSYSYDRINAYTNSIYFNGYGDGIRFVVKDTSVFMDTYINVIFNETFNLNTYYPQSSTPYPRIDLKSFAIYGSGISINNSYYPVTDGYITVTDTNDRERNLLLDNVSIIYKTATDENVYLKFNNDNVLVNLGSQVNRSITFYGMWYMAADLYSGEKKITTGYEFNPLQWAFSDNNVAIIFYLGLLALCSIIAARYSSMGWADIILVSCAGIVGFLLLV